MEASRGKSICVPFESEEHYEACISDPALFRGTSMELYAHFPELFPAKLGEGFWFHDKRLSKK